MWGDKGGAGFKGHWLIAESGGACWADLRKGQAGSSSFKQFTWTGLSWGKRNLFVPLINSSFLPFSCLHLSWKKLVNILSSPPSAYVNSTLISNSLIISTFVMWCLLLSFPFWMHPPAILFPWLLLPRGRAAHGGGPGAAVCKVPCGAQGSSPPEAGCSTYCGNRSLLLS